MILTLIQKLILSYKSTGDKIFFILVITQMIFPKWKQ